MFEAHDIANTLTLGNVVFFLFCFCFCHALSRFATILLLVKNNLNIRIREHVAGLRGRRPRRPLHLSPVRRRPRVIEHRGMIPSVAQITIYFVDHLYIQILYLPLCCVVQEPYSTDPTQQTMPYI